MSLRTIARFLLPRGMRNFMRNPRAVCGWVLQRVQAKVGRTTTVEILPGWSVKADPRSVLAARTIATDPSCLAEMRGMIRHFRDGMVLLDVGANLGLVTLAVLHFGGPTARSIAVDPSGEALDVLRNNLKLAGVEDRVIVVCAAVGAEDGTLHMLTAGAAGEHFYLAADEKRPDTKVLPQRRLATLVKDVGLRPTHVKVDVEGFEYEVLAGGVDFLREVRPVIYLELHCSILRSRKKDPAAVLAFLEQAGYRQFFIEERPVEAAELVRMDSARIVCLPE